MVGVGVDARNIDDLAIAPLARGLRRHRKAWTDAAAGEMRRQLTYKADCYGSDLWLADHWYPSSVRRYRGKLLTKPGKAAVKRIGYG